MTDIGVNLMVLGAILLAVLSGLADGDWVNCPLTWAIIACVYGGTFVVAIGALCAFFGF